MKDVRRWPRFRVQITLEIAAPCADAALDVAQEYVTRARNDNGTDRAPFVAASWKIPASQFPTEPAYVVDAYTDAAPREMR